MKLLRLLLLFILVSGVGLSMSGQVLTEDFEGTFPATGWSIAKNSGNDWTQNTSAGNGGGKCAQYTYNSSNAADSWLFTNGVALTAGDTYSFSFYQKVASSTWPEKMKFTVGTAATIADQTTVLLDLGTVSNTSYVQHTGAFTPSSSGTYYFAFQCYSDANQYNLYVDDLEVYAPAVTPPNCTVLSTPADVATAINTTTDLTWTAASGQPTGYKIDLGTTTGGTDILNDYNAGLVTTYDLPSDLTYNTTYYATVKPYNGNGPATGCIETSFTTKDGCVTPYTPSNGSTTADINQTISWSSLDAGVVKYIVSIGTTAGGTDILNAHDNGTSTSYTTSGLNYSTQYYVSIKAENANGLTTAACNTYNFTTEADPTLTPPFVEAFASYPATNWTEAKGQLAAPTTFTSTSSNWTNGSFGNTGSNVSAYMNIYSTGRYEWFISPSINLGSGTNYQLEFDLALTPWTGTSQTALGVDDKVAVVISTDDGVTWTSANTLQQWVQGDAISPTGDHIVIDLSAYSGIVKLGFYGESTVSNTDMRLYVDNVEVKEIPTCSNPTNLGTSTITATTATATWDVQATATSGYNWEIVPSGDGQGNNVVTSGSVGVGVTSASVTGLTANTSYDLYVQSDCGGNGTAWSSAYTFTTSCAAVSTFPYTEDFDGTLNNNVWNCWKVINANSDSYMWSQANTYISPAHSGTYAAHGMGNSDDYLITPQLTVGANALRIRFWDRVESSTRNNTYTIKVSTTGTDAADFTTDIITIDCSNTSWTEHVVDLSAYTNQSIYVAFHQTYSAATNYGFGIDDFTAEEIPACEPVTVLGTASITTTTADLSWTQGASSETAWEIAIQAQGTGTPAGAGTAVSSGLSGATVTYNATSLTQNTDYEFYVRADCGGGDFSTWVGPVNFTTIATCLPSSALTSTTITETTAVLDWTSGGSGESTWEVAVQAQGTGTPAGAGTSTGTKPYTAMGLTGDTDYEFYVRADCGGGDFSDWSGPHNFTTLPTPPTTAQGVTCTTPNGASTILFTEDFETDPPSGWTGSFAGNNGQWDITGGNANSTETGPSASYAGSKHMEYEASNTTTNQGSVVSPAIDLTSASDDAELSFWMHAYGASMGTLEVGVGTAAAGPFTNVFTWTGQYQTADTDSWINVGVDLTAYVGQTIYIQFTQIDDNNAASINGGYDGDMSIDEMSVTACVVAATPPNCDAAMTSPSDAATNVAVNSDISWSLATGFPTGYKLQIGTTMGGSEFLAQTDVGNVLTYNPANDFDFNTTYYVNITPYNANGDATTGCTEYSFTTIDGCITATTPSNAATDVGVTSSVSWSALSVAGYKVSIGTTAGGTDIINAVDNGTATTYDMSGASLAYNTTYYLTITAYNNAGDDAIGCSSTSFTTELAPPANDECAGAFVIDLANSTVSGNSNSASESQTGCSGNEDDDVWFTFTALADDDAIITVSPTGADPINDIVFQLLSGTCGSLTSIACKDGTGSSSDEVLTQAVTNGTTYYIRVYSYYGTGDEGEFTVNVSTNVLPVEMTSFTAKAEGNVNVLNWETASEENNARFDVERSTNGVDFETIGQVEGNGTTVEVSNYNFVDETPATVSYYRLRQVDFDGNFENSRIVIVKRKGGNNNVALYPVPVQNRLTVQYSATANEEMTITVTDVTGRTVVTKAVTAIQGENQFKVDLNDLPSGSYFVRLQSDTNNIIRTIIKE